MSTCEMCLEWNKQLKTYTFTLIVKEIAMQNEGSKTIKMVGTNENVEPRFDLVNKNEMLLNNG